MRDQRAGFLNPKPLFEKNQAEEDFVIVLAAGFVKVEQGADARGPEVLVNLGLRIEQRVSHFVVDGVPEPIVDDVDGEAAFLAF